MHCKALSSDARGSSSGSSRRNAVGVHKIKLHKNHKFKSLDSFRYIVKRGQTPTLFLSKPVNCSFILIIEIRFDWHFKTRQDVNTVNIAFRVVFSLWMSAACSKV